MHNSILILSDWFYPGFKAGGPIKSVTNLSIAIQKQFNVFVYTSDTDLNETEPYKNIESDTWLKVFNDSEVKVYYSSKKNQNSKTLKRVIQEVNPTCIYLNHMWSYRFVLQPLFITWWSFKNIKIVLCPRGAFFESALHHNKTYLKKRLVLAIIKLLGIHKKIHFHATTEQEKKTIEHYFGKANITIANNLPDTHQPNISFINKETGSLKIIYIARILDIKNLKFLLTNLKQTTSPIELTIAGPIEDENYWASCKNIIDVLPSNIKVNYIGEVAPKDIIPLIQQYHLYCLPTKGENFGHSIFEAFVAGRPVLISNKTPWLNLQDSKVGWDVDIENDNSFVEPIQQALAWNQEEFNSYCKGAWQLAFDYINNPNLITDYSQLF